MFTISPHYAYCPHCGVDLETENLSAQYKYKKHLVYFEDCPVCKTCFVLDFNGFCEIVDKNFPNGHKVQNSGLSW